MGFDKQYAKVTARVEGLLAFVLFDNLGVKGKENLHKNPQRQRMYLANHLSHADYGFLWHVLYREGLPIPAIAAGKNLDLTALKAVHFDFSKLGAFWIDREAIKNGNGTGNKREIIEVSRQIEADKKSILLFPEGGRSYDGSVMEKEFATPLIRTLMHLDMDVVPVAFAYDNRYEGWALPYMGKHKAAKNWKYYTGELSALLARPLVRLTGMAGNAYMNVGEPIPISQLAVGKTRNEKLTKLEDFTRAEVKRLYNEVKPQQNK